jgi:hypothetical protein
VAASRTSTFDAKLEQGHLSFKSKFEWLFGKAVITESDRRVMDEIRRIRNEQVHSRPTGRRPKYKYSGIPLMTRKALRQLLIDVQPLVEKLRRTSGSKETRGVIPESSRHAFSMKKSGSLRMPDRRLLSNTYQAHGCQEVKPVRSRAWGVRVRGLRVPP